MKQEIKKTVYELNSEDIMKTATFRKVDGTAIPNVAEYIKNYFVAKRSEGLDGFQIFIGTDSQRIRRGRLTIYATVICLYTVGKGAHVIYAKTKRNDIAPTSRKNKKMGRMADAGLFYRLQWEINYSMNVAHYLNSHKVFAECGIGQVHVDISTNPENDSAIAYSYATSYVNDPLYNLRVKPEAIAASYAADMVVRK